MNCPCECPSNGDSEYHCPRLDCRMTPKLCRLYQTRDDYRRAWDEGRGPGQLKPNRDKKKQKKRPTQTCAERRRESAAEKYDAESQAFALSLCMSCPHLNRQTDKCEQTDCSRLRRWTCQERINRHGERCPIGMW